MALTEKQTAAIAKAVDESVRQLLGETLLSTARMSPEDQVDACAGIIAGAAMGLAVFAWHLSGEEDRPKLEGVFAEKIAEALAICAELDAQAEEGATDDDA